MFIHRVVYYFVCVCVCVFTILALLSVSVVRVQLKVFFFFRAAKKSSRKLTRAFSFNRTPRRAPPRAVSNLLSPAPQTRSQSATANASADPANQTSSLTPSISMTSLCTPKRDQKLFRLPSTTSLQVGLKSYNVSCSSPYSSSASPSLS